MSTKILSTPWASVGRRVAAVTAVFAAVLLCNSLPADASLQTVTVGGQSTVLLAGSAGTTTFPISIIRSGGTPNTTTTTVSGLPAGATASFGAPSNWSPTFGTGTRTYVLTVNVTAAVAAGSYGFTVQASGTGPDPIGAGTLLVSSPQTITFDPLPDRTFGAPDFAVNATSSSGLPVSFAASNNCTVDAGTVHLTGAGSCTITASQPGNGVYLPAPAVQRTFAIAKGDQAITFGPLPDRTVWDNAFVLTGTSSSGLPLVYVAEGECSVLGAQVVLTGTAGPCTITASQPGDANWNPAPLDVEQSFDIVYVAPTAELWAEPGAMAGPTALPGLTTLPVFGYNTSDTPVDRPGGPTITVTQGQRVVLVLHNETGESSSMVVRGQHLPTDQVGVASGGVRAYTFTPTEPGTFIYEAGVLNNTQHQVAMGLFGALIVEPSSGPVGNDAVVVVSEIDPALNASTPPASFDMRKFAPKYTLLNGAVHPNTATLGTVAPGDDVRVRYVNAGVNYHSMSILGANQRIVADDGHALAQPYTVVAETVGPGQSFDSVVHVSATAAAGTQLTVFDGNLQLRNRNRRPATASASVTYGGAMAFIDVAGTTDPTDTTGPVASNLVATNTSISAHISDLTTGGNNVTAAEYSIDGAPAIPFGGIFGTPEVDLSATFAALGGGSHTIRVRGTDAASNTGAWASVVVSNDNVGPASTGLTLTPNPTNGMATVALHATGSDAATGGSNVSSATYTIDAGTLAATTAPMTVGPAAVTVSLDATIPAGLPQGEHMVTVQANDAVGNVGPDSPVAVLTIDSSGPAITSAVIVSPSRTNGTVGVNSSTPAVRVTASATDPVSNIVAAEGFIDPQVPLPPAGTGFIFLPSDGAWNAKTEAVTVDIPLTTISALTDGLHHIVIRAKDASGNWGATDSGDLTIDRTPPTVTGIARDNPTPTTAPSVSFSVTFSEPVTGVTAGNFTLAGTAPGTVITSVTGSGATRTVTVSTGTVGGTLGLNLTTTAGIKDVAGNALAASGVPFVGPLYTILTPPLYFSTVGNSNPPGIAAATADDADIYYWNGTAFSRVIDANGTGSLGLPAGANVDGFDRVDATHFYMSFNGTVAVPVLGNVQDEDVVYYNAGTWSVFFDGTPASRGLANSDVDAVSVVGSTLYFSLDDTDIPTGVVGTGDDADIYSWNGTSMARVINASGAGSLGWSSNNVDGLVWIDATHLYLSYSDTTTAVPVLGNVQDEDVVYYSAGTWSVYFDGTAKGLTSNNTTTANNLDVDAFDLP